MHSLVPLNVVLVVNIVCLLMGFAIGLTWKPDAHPPSMPSRKFAVELRRGTPTEWTVVVAESYHYADGRLWFTVTKMDEEYVRASFAADEVGQIAEAIA